MKDNSLLDFLTKLKQETEEKLVLNKELIKEYKKSTNRVKFSLKNKDNILENIKETPYYLTLVESYKNFQSEINKILKINKIESLLQAYKILNQNFEFVCQDLTDSLSFLALNLEEDVYIYNIIRLNFNKKYLNYISLVTSKILEKLNNFKKS